MERVQRQATKFILRDYNSDYRTRLLKLDLLPLMYLLDFYDIVFFIKALKQPSAHFNIFHYVSFSATNTRSTSTNKLVHVHSNNNYTRTFYFNRLPKLWNKLPFINLNHSISTIKTTIYTYLQDHFKNNFVSDKPCTYHFCCRCSNCYNLGTPSNYSVM